MSVFRFGISCKYSGLVIVDDKIEESIICLYFTSTFFPFSPVHPRGAPDHFWSGAVLALIQPESDDGCFASGVFGVCASRPVWCCQRFQFCRALSRKIDPLVLMMPRLRGQSHMGHELNDPGASLATQNSLWLSASCKSRNFNGCFKILRGQIIRTVLCLCILQYFSRGLHTIL